MNRIIALSLLLTACGQEELAEHSDAIWVEDDFGDTTPSPRTNRGGCDPVLQNCSQGEGCYPIGNVWVCAPDASGRGGAYGWPCEFINVCNPGLVCLDSSAVPDCAGSSGCCSEICDLTDPAGNAQCSGAGQTCLPWSQTGNIGICVLQ